MRGNVNEADAAELKWLRARLRDMEEVLGRVEEGVACFRDGCVTWCNGRFAELAGSEAGALVGAAVEEALPLHEDGVLLPADEHPVKLLRARAFASSGVYQVHSNGAIRDVEVRVQRSVSDAPPEDPVCDGTLVVRDVSRRQAEELARLQGAALEAAANAVVICDISGCVLWVNPAFTQLTGQAASKVLGQDIRTLSPYRECTPEWDEIWSEIQRGGVWQGRVECLRADGQWYLEENTVTPVHFAHAPPRVILIKQDATERVRLERELSTMALAAARTSNGVVITDGEGRVEWINEGFRRITGYSLDEVKGLKPGEMLQGPATDPETVEHMHLCMRFKEGFHVEIVNYNKNGNPYWIALEVQPVCDEDGVLTHYIGIQSDITRRVEAQQALEESEARYRYIVENAVDIIFEADLEGRFTYANAVAEKVTGYPLDEILQMDYFQLVRPDWRRRVQEAVLNHVMTGDEGVYVEFPIVARGGEEVWIGQTVRFMKREGVVQGYQAVARDVTQRRRAEEALRESEQRFRDISETIPGVIYQWRDGPDDHMGFTYVSPRARELFGLDPDDLVEDWTIVRIHPDDWDPVMRGVAKSRAEMSDWRGELRIFLPDGSLRWWQAAARPVPAEGGALLYNGVLLDITDRKQAEQELARVREQEAEVGARIQQELLLGQAPDEIEGADIGAFTIPTQHIDGDFYAFFVHSETLFDVVLGDVMGKGILAALTGAAVRSQFLEALSRLARGRGEPPAPAQLVSYVQAELAPQLIALETFATVLYARFDLAAGVLRYVDCGHTRTIHAVPEGEAVHFLKGSNMPIGFIEEEEIVEHKAAFAPGDVFFLYSDGVTDTRDPWGASFGEQRLGDRVRQSREEGAASLLERVRHEILRFSGGRGASDDVSCVAVCIGRKPAPNPLEAHHAFDSELRQLPQVRHFLRECCRRVLEHPPPDEVIEEAELGLTEVVSNIMRHAYGGRTDGRIELRVRGANRSLDVEVMHWGAAFQPEAVRLPTAASSTKGGLGLFIIEQVFDEVQYICESEGGNRILLRKDWK
jgi:PAS domain S-box-containing protein